MCFDEENGGYYLEEVLFVTANALRSQTLKCDWSARIIEQNIPKLAEAWVALEGLQ